MSSADQPHGKPVAVKVSNVGAGTSIRDLYNHFAYAGTIASIHIQPGSGSPGVAHLLFLEEKALETALLLSDSAVRGSIIRVEPGPPGYTPPPDARFYHGAPPPQAEAAVKVSNLSPGTTLGDLQDFFAFAGNVSSIEMHPGTDGGGGEAYVGFYEKSALETSVLLSGAKVKGSLVKVEDAPGYQAPITAKFFPKPGATPDTPMKQAEAALRRLVEQSMVLGTTTAQRAREFDQKHQLSHSATTKAVELRDSAAAAMTDLQKRFMESPGVFKSFQGGEHVNRSVDSVDKQYHVTEKTQGVISSAEKQLSDFGSYLMQNKYLSQSHNYFWGPTARVSDEVVGASSRPEATTSTALTAPLTSAAAQTESRAGAGGDTAGWKVKAGPGEPRPSQSSTHEADDEDDEPLEMSTPAASAAAPPALLDPARESRPRTRPSTQVPVNRAPAEDDTPVF